MARSYQQYMSPGGAQSRMGLLDLFPALGQWVQGNRDALMAPYRENAAEQAATLLGAPAAQSYQTDDMGLTTGVETAGSGLMADPDDFFKQMQYAQGLMGTPGYESAGQNFASQALQYQLGTGAREQLQKNWQAEDARAEQKYQLEMRDKNRALENTYRDDFEKASAPYRQSVQIYEDFQNMAAQRGSVENWTLIDDVATIKNVAKQILPSEAVIGDDAALLAMADQLPEGIRGMISQTLNVGKPLSATQRRDLAQTMTERAGMNLKRMELLEDQYRGSAARDGLVSENIVRNRLATDQNRYTKPIGGIEQSGGPGTTVSPGRGLSGGAPPTIEQLKKAADEQNPKGYWENIWDAVTD